MKAGKKEIQPQGVRKNLMKSWDGGVAAGRVELVVPVRPSLTARRAAKPREMMEGIASALKDSWVKLGAPYAGR
jgi:hypothetical protein